jgi:hypothetical protein
MEPNRAVASRSLGTPMALTILSASGFACHALVNQAHKSSVMFVLRRQELDVFETAVSTLSRSRDVGGQA